MSVPMMEEDARVLAAREQWRYRGQERPPFAIEPAHGQLSVWDFPRPPMSEPVPATLTVRAGDQLLAKTERGIRICETAGAPTYYFPPEDVIAEVNGQGPGSICEWKGLAESVTVGGIRDAGWRYIRMFPAFAELHEWIAFYPMQVDCFVGDEQVTPQPGGYYGGWVTRELVGPIKGEPGISG